MSYNYNYTSSHSYKAVKKPTLLGRLGTALMLLISLFIAALFMLTLLTPYVEPSSGWTSPILGLVAPATFIATLLLALYWIIRWQWIVATPLIIVLFLGASNISLFAKIPMTKSYGTESYAGTIKVMSYNVRALVNDKKQRSTSDVARYVASQQADIICLQEFVTMPDSDDDSFDLQLKGYHKSLSGALAIYSRFPIYRAATLMQNSSSNSTSGGSMWADIIIKDDTLRVFNSHLHSTDIKAEDDTFLTTSQLVRDNERNEKVRSIITRFNRGSVERALQVKKIAKSIYRSPYSVIVCGDFNDTAMSYTYKRISNGLLDSFQECGDVYPYTYRGFYNTLRIDYILSSKRITPQSYSVDTECHYSDHLPVTTHLKINHI
ncbi:MAG: endonuclease/exonuclease/phosphatase family protein [Rikenellaceae bacterium]